MAKECFGCKEIKDISFFYKHKAMKDGYLGKCKECIKADVSKNRSNNIEYYRAYDRERGNRQAPEYTKQYRKDFPNKYKAHIIVNNAIRDKKLFSADCKECGSSERLHAHHDDYSKPLNVRWLCAACHHTWHSKNGEALNAV